MKKSVKKHTEKIGGKDDGGQIVLRRCLPFSFWVFLTVLVVSVFCLLFCVITVQEGSHIDNIVAILSTGGFIGAIGALLAFTYACLHCSCPLPMPEEESKREGDNNDDDAGNW